MLEICEVIVVVSLAIVAITGMVWCRSSSQNKDESDEIEREDVDLPEPPAQNEEKEDMATADLRQMMTKFPGSHRQAIISSIVFHKKPMARYETARGGWSWARVVAVYGQFAVLKRQGTEFVRTIQYT